MKVVITGGHLSPAISVMEAVPQDWEVFFIGRKSSFEGDSAPALEYQAIKDLNIPFFSIPNSRLQRKFTIYTIPSLIKAPIALSRSIQLLKQIRPDAVLGLGGYISFPVCLAAYFLKIPVIIHEQTLQAGAANKIIGKWAKTICISWKSSEDFFPMSKVVLTGNPIRKEILNSSEFRIQNLELPVIYITGGSTGSHFINELIRDGCHELLKKYQIIHQTGDSEKYKDFEKLTEVKKTLSLELSKRYTLTKFTPVADVGKIIQKATLVIGRAGINTVTELLYLKKPAILIPIPNSANDEQLKNAEFLKNAGLAEILIQEKATPASFIAKIALMMENIENYRVQPEFENLITPKAAAHIIAVVEDVAQTTE